MPKKIGIGHSFVNKESLELEKCKKKNAELEKANKELVEKNIELEKANKELEKQIKKENK